MVWVACHAAQNAPGERGGGFLGSLQDRPFDSMGWGWKRGHRDTLGNECTNVYIPGSEGGNGYFRKIEISGNEMQNRLRARG